MHEKVRRDGVRFPSLLFIMIVTGETMMVAVETKTRKDRTPSTLRCWVPVIPTNQRMTTSMNRNFRGAVTRHLMTKGPDVRSGHEGKSVCKSTKVGRCGIMTSQDE